MAIDISNTTRRIVYTGSAGTGPYAFAFEVLAETDIAVYFNETELTLTTDYTVSISGTGTGNVTIVTGTNVPATPDADDRITIVGDRAIERSTDFTTGGPLFAQSLNDEFDSLTIFTQQNLEQSNRSLRAPNTDPTTVNMELPLNTIRANKYLTFDVDGNPIAQDAVGTYRGNWAASTVYVLQDIVKDTSNSNIYICITAHTSSGSQPISSNADVAKWSLVVDSASAAAAQAAAEAAQAAAETAETNAETAETNAETAETNAETAQTAAEVAQAAAEVAQAGAETAETNAETAETGAQAAQAAAEAVFDNFDDAYLGAKTSDPTVDNDGDPLADGALYYNTTDDVMKVYDLATTTWYQLTPTVSNQTNINTVAGISADVTAVAGNNANVSTVAGISGNVTTVAGISADVTSVASDATDIGTVATDIADVNTVAGSIANVNSVAGNSANINAVAGNATNINTVAADATNINIVAADGTDIGAVATNIVNVNKVAAIDANVTTVAGIDTNVTTVAGISGDVTTVAGQNTEIALLGTADAVSDMNTLGTASIVSDMDTLADVSSDITTVSGVSSNVTTVAGISSDVTSVAGVSANVTTVATDITNVNTAATNISPINYFATQYLGVQSSAPVTTVTGALYYDSVDEQLYIWDGAAWQQAAFSASGTVLSFNTRDGAVTLNSSDVTTALTYTPADVADLGSIASQDANNVTITGGSVVGMPSPTVSNAVATKGYVDSAVAGLKWKTAVQLHADSNISLTGTTGTLVIDGHAALVTADAGYRLLLTGQSTDSEKGIYDYTDNGSTYTLVRSSDADVYTELEGASVFVQEGTAYAATGWTENNYELTDFTGQTWVQFAGAGTYAAGLGLTLTGNVFAVDVDVLLTGAIGTNVQAWDAGLDDIAALTPTDSNFIVGDGANWVAETGATARTSLGLGSLATLNTVGAAQIDTNAVTSAKIAANSVGADELNVAGNGTAGQYLGSDGDGTMTWTTISSDPSVGGDLSGTASNAQIVAGAVGTTELAADAVTSAKLANDAVGAEHIQANAVSASELNVSGNGTAGQNLTSDGDGSMTWASAAAGGFSNMQVFTSPGTWTNPGSVTKVKVTVLGGGGSGNWGNFTGANIAGGTSSFGAYCSATGGGINPYGNLRAGGVGTGGNINLRGSAPPSRQPTDYCMGGASALGYSAAIQPLRVVASYGGGGTGNPTGYGGEGSGGGAAIELITLPTSPVSVTVGAGGTTPYAPAAPAADRPPLAGGSGLVIVEY